MKGLKYFLENINEAVKTPEEWMHDEDSVLVRLPGNPSVDEVMEITNGVITWTGPQDINYGDGVEFDAPIPNFVKFFTILYNIWKNCLTYFAINFFICKRCTIFVC